ncbi:MAG: DNA polymerase III subunit alpha [bacterium]|nr:DNA polymerase III subunit alpha [bacterium]
MTNNSKFTHLHVHSHYSLLSALPKIPDLVKTAKKDGMEALALTDNGNMYGAIEFYKECKKNHIKPIIGVDFYLAARTRHNKEHGIDNHRTRLILLSKNLDGYKNLMKLVTKSNLEGFYYKPRIDEELMRDNHEGLIAIIPAFNGQISSALRGNDFVKAEEILKKYSGIFGQENVFMEITHHPDIEGQAALTKNIISLSKKMGVPLVATNDVYYLKPEDKRAREIVMSIQGNPDFEKNNFDSDTSDFSFLSGETMEKLFEDAPEAILNTQKIATMCNLELKLGTWMFPNLIVESGKTPEDELRDITYKGIKRLNLTETPEIFKRIEYELKIITMKGFAPYFLVVADLLKYAHEHGILSNIRGSVSGSIVTYLSGITNINPLQYEIPFERFLNPERPGAPDIDMDFADDRRDEIIEYARNKYGRNHVAQIGTFGTMMARGAVRDVARAMGYPYGVGDRIAKLIPIGSQGFPMTIDHALEITPELKEIYLKEADVKEIIDMSQKIEGNARHISIHAAGVVISPLPLEELTPIQFDPKESGKTITQYDMYSIEEAGLLKFDFLGLKNLSIIASSLKLIKKFNDIEIKVNDIPIDDKKTYEMLARGETADTFQLNGSGMTRFLMDLKPNTIHDINAMVALYRPGPMQFIPDYIARKHNPRLIRYPDPALEPILQKTYGILVYQDDLLMIANRLAGYSWGEVDKFRKAVGKKIPKEMAEQKEKFIKGCMEYSKWSEKKSTEIWTWIEPFAAYGFNKAHSVSYGLVAYQTAYLKANFPGEYMTAVLSAESGDVEKVAESIKECERMGLPVLPPDINECRKDFTLIRESGGDPKSASPIGQNKIRFGLASIKNFGEGIADAIIDERKKDGKFTTLGNFLSRIKDRNLNKKSLEALIYAGALDKLGERGQMLVNTESLLAYNREEARGNSDQTSLFGALPQQGDGLVLKEAPPMEQDEKLKWEKELLGLYISGHPLDKYKKKLEGRTMTIEIIKNMQEGMLAVVSGLLEEVKPMLTKAGDQMLFLRMADFTGSIEVVVFPRTYTEAKDLLIKDNCIAIKGKISHRNGGVSLIAEAVKAL